MQPDDTSEPTLDSTPDSDASVESGDESEELTFLVSSPSLNDTAAGHHTDLPRKPPDLLFDDALQKERTELSSRPQSTSSHSAAEVAGKPEPEILKNTDSLDFGMLLEQVDQTTQIFDTALDLYCEAQDSFPVIEAFHEAEKAFGALTLQNADPVKEALVQFLGQGIDELEHRLDDLQDRFDLLPAEAILNPIATQEFCERFTRHASLLLLSARTFQEQGIPGILRDGSEAQDLVQTLRAAAEFAPEAASVVARRILQLAREKEGLPPASEKELRELIPQIQSRFGNEIAADLQYVLFSHSKELCE